MPERAALMAVLILERPMCLDCMETKTGMDRHETEAYLQHLRRSHGDRCRMCGTVGTVYWLVQPA